MFEEHHWLDATFKIPRPVLIGKTVCCMCIIFNLRMRLYGCLLFGKMESEKRGRKERAPGIPPLTPWKSADITRRYFWGACLRDWMAPSTKHSLLSDTHSHTLSHTHTNTHTLTAQGTIPPTALSPHLFLPNISIMKCTVIYVSSDSAGPENEVLVSCMDL